MVTAARFAILDRLLVCRVAKTSGSEVASMTVNWGTGGAHVLILGLKVQLREIIWGLKFLTPKCASWGLKFRVS